MSDGYGRRMTRAMTIRLGLGAALGFIGGVLTLLDGSPLGWIGIVCGVFIVAVVLIERRRSRS